MKQFDPLQFDVGRCRREVAELQTLLAAQDDLKENRDVLPFFRARPHLAAFIGERHPDILRFDRLAFEYDLFGDFACDLVVGDSVTKAYCFVEFEEGGPNSLFVRRGPKSTPEWSPRFEHGYSQIVDWYYKLDDMQRTDDFEARFGARTIEVFGLLVVGRSVGLEPREQRRLAWRQKRTLVNHQPIFCLTFDQLAAYLADVLTSYPFHLPPGANPPDPTPSA